MTTTPSPERAALEAVLEALDIPHAATAGDEETRREILAKRVFYAVIMLRSVLERDDATEINWDVTYLREHLAGIPAQGYKTQAERAAELGAAR